MSDTISRQQAIDAIMGQPPELPKQFMSDDCISRTELYKKVCEAEKLARERVLDTPSDSPFPNKLNPAYTRYSAQLDERTQFKHMIADARSVQPEQQWIPSGEKPPEKGSYLVWMPFASSKHRMTVAEYCGGYWNIKTPISAWMPLPEPYKGE